ncbi:MAG: NAD(P)-dependent oxidoreductase [Deltaproteobacteria bacterium]|nr:NAD(P)-dependent oxidoreductase [Deltaproteobacteria bacterium]
MKGLKRYKDHEGEIAFVKNKGLPRTVQNAIYQEGLKALKQRMGRHHQPERTILLVGGAGYIGTVLTAHLLRCGYRVRCLDLLLYQNQVCVLPFLSNDHYEFIYGDLADASIHDAVLSGVTDVVLLAGLVGDPITKKYPEASEVINDTGLLQLIKNLQGRGLNKVIFVSTCSNYGLIKTNELADENFALSPLSLYAKAKVRVEKEILSQKGRVDYHGTVLRFATAFGLSPRMRFDLTVNEFAREIFLKHDLLVYDADTWRPYCHVQDFCTLIERVLVFPTGLVSFEVFNCGGAVNNFTKQMIVDKVREFLPDARVSYKEHGTDPRNYKVDFKKVRERLFFEPRYTVADGISEIIKAMQQNLFVDIEKNREFFGNYSIEYKMNSVGCLQNSGGQEVVS